jgi:hypothetical protein
MGVLGGQSPPNTPYFLPHPGNSQRAKKINGFHTQKVKLGGEEYTRERYGFFENQPENHFDFV